MGVYVNPYDFVRHNTKVKKYRDGSCTVIYCDKNIFMPENEVLISEEEFGKDVVNYMGRLRSQERRECEKNDYEIAKEKFAETGAEHYFNFIQQYERKMKAKEERIRNDSMKRAIDKVYDIAFQNEWSYFFTGTLSDDNDFSRYDPKEIIKPLNQWLNNQVKRRGLQYILIPEIHPEKGEGIHFHGLINESLSLSDSGRVLYRDGKAWRRDDVEAKGEDITKYKTIYNVDNWKYGFSTAIPVSGSPARLAAYIVKYVTKDCQKLFGRYYYSSRNIIKEAENYYLHTDEFEKCKAPVCSHGGMKFKYESDFLMHEDDTRDPTAEILKFLQERGGTF